MYSAMNDLPVGTPEQAGLLAVGKANFMQNMKDPVKNKLMTAMMGNAVQQLGKAFSPGPMQGSQRAPKFDLYGNPLG